jgi:hypothetical protein
MDEALATAHARQAFDRPSLKARAAAAVAAVVVSATTLGAVLTLYADPGIAVVTARAIEQVVAAPAGATRRLAMTQTVDRRMESDDGPALGPRVQIRTRPCVAERRLCV